MATIEISSVEQLDKLAATVRASADRTVRSIRNILGSETDSLQVLRLMKFSEIGQHPTDDRPLNLIEQVNQTFTYLVTLEAARRILARHPDCGGLKVHLGTAAGFDVESQLPGVVAAEAFAATHPASNNKLRKDVEKLLEKADGVTHRYVFFSCPKFPSGRHANLESSAGVQVWSLAVESLHGAKR